MRIAIADASARKLSRPPSASIPYGFWMATPSPSITAGSNIQDSRAIPRRQQAGGRNRQRGDGTVPVGK